MKIILPQKFGLPGAGRQMPTGRKFFGEPVIPMTAVRETTRLVIWDVLDENDWRRGNIVDLSCSRGWADPNANVRPRGSLLAWWQELEEEEWYEDD